MLWRERGRSSLFHLMQKNSASAFWTVIYSQPVFIVIEVDRYVTKKQTGSWNAGNSKIAKQSERNLCPSVSPSKDSLNQVWQLTAPWQLGSVKGKVAQVFLGLWLQRCSGATAHHSIKGDYRDRAICCQNKREPFYVSSCMVVWLCVCQRMCVCEGSKAKRARHRIPHVAVEWGRELVLIWAGGTKGWNQGE